MELRGLGPVKGDDLPLRFRSLASRYCQNEKVSQAQGSAGLRPYDCNCEPDNDWNAESKADNHDCDVGSPTAAKHVKSVRPSMPSVRDVLCQDVNIATGFVQRQGADHSHHDKHGNVLRHDMPVASIELLQICLLVRVELRSRCSWEDCTLRQPPE